MERHYVFRYVVYIDIYPRVVCSKWHGFFCLEKLSDGTIYIGKLKDAYIHFGIRIHVVNAG